MKTKNVSITKCRPRAVRNDWLVRGVGKRAIHIAQEGERADLSEYEAFWLLWAVAEAANKRGWKNVWFVVNSWTLAVSIHNCHEQARYGPKQRKQYILGSLFALTEQDHFLNDDYLTPKGSLIK
jgi:hypothetical protein